MAPVACPPNGPTTYAQLLACVLPAIYRSPNVVLSGTACARERSELFVCTTEYTDRRTGETRRYRLHVLRGGEVFQ